MVKNQVDRFFRDFRMLGPRRTSPVPIFSPIKTFMTIFLAGMARPPWTYPKKIPEKTVNLIFDHNQGSPDGHMSVKFLFTTSVELFPKK